MGLEVGCVDHGCLLLATFSRKADHDPSEDAFVTPTLPTVVQCLVWTVLFGCVPPPQAIAIDEDNAAQHTPIINTWLAVGLGKAGPQSRHLRVRQPEEIRHVTARFARGESCSHSKINGS